MLNCSASLAMSTSVLKALPGKLDIKRHSPSILYLSYRMTLEEERQDIPGEQSHYLTNGVPYSPARTRPMIHPCLDPPLCEDCQKLELSFFDPDCPGCRKILNNSNTKVPEIYAILRQWTPQTQQNLELLVNEVNILMV